MTKELSVLGIFFSSEGLNGGGGYLDNSKHFIFWLCNMKQSNFRHFNTNSNKFFDTVIFFPERSKNGSKKANNIFFSTSRSFRPFYDNSRFFRKISEGYRRFPKTNEVFRPLPKMSEEPSEHLTVFSSKNMKKLANLTANTKNHGQITVNTKPHSDPLLSVGILNQWKV